MECGPARPPGPTPATAGAGGSHKRRAWETGDPPDVSPCLDEARHQFRVGERLTERLFQSNRLCVKRLLNRLRHDPPQRHGNGPHEHRTLNQQALSIATDRQSAQFPATHQYRIGAGFGEAVDQTFGLADVRGPADRQAERLTRLGDAFTDCGHRFTKRRSASTRDDDRTRDVASMKGHPASGGSLNELDPLTDDPVVRDPFRRRLLVAQRDRWGLPPEEPQRRVSALSQAFITGHLCCRGALIGHENLPGSDPAPCRTLDGKRYGPFQNSR